jgi:hypothetical protein
MKQAILSLEITLASLHGHPQTNGLDTGGNGLIYFDATMTQLRRIVDSLQLKFRQCNPDREYFSIPQTSASFISLDTAECRPRQAAGRGRTGQIEGSRQKHAGLPEAKTGRPLIPPIQPHPLRHPIFPPRYKNPSKRLQLFLS